MYQSNIALLSVAPSKSCQKHSSCLWHSQGLDLKAAFQSNYLKNFSPPKHPNSGKGLSLQRVLWHSPYTENLGFGKGHPLKTFPAATVLCDRDCYQTYLDLKQHPDTKSIAEVMRKWRPGLYITKNFITFPTAKKNLCIDTMQRGIDTHGACPESHCKWILVTAEVQRTCSGQWQEKN